MRVTQCSVSIPSRLGSSGNEATRDWTCRFLKTKFREPQPQRIFVNISLPRLKLRLTSWPLGYKAPHVSRRYPTSLPSPESPLSSKSTRNKRNLSQSFIMNSLKNAGHAISEKAQEVAHGTSYQANKEVAKGTYPPSLPFPKVDAHKPQIPMPPSALGKRIEFRMLNTREC